MTTMTTPNTIPVHISSLKVGDTVWHHSQLVTVGEQDLKTSANGTTFRGDSYKLGYQLIERVTYR